MGNAFLRNNWKRILNVAYALPASAPVSAAAVVEEELGAIPVAALERPVAPLGAVPAQVVVADEALVRPVSPLVSPPGVQAWVVPPDAVLPDAEPAELAVQPAARALLPAVPVLLPAVPDVALPVQVSASAANDSPSAAPPLGAEPQHYSEESPDDSPAQHSDAPPTRSVAQVRAVLPPTAPWLQPRV
jgi:hypothetical protein